MENHSYTKLILYGWGSWGASEFTHSFTSLSVSIPSSEWPVRASWLGPSGDPLDAGFHPPLRGEDRAGKGPAQG